MGPSRPKHLSAPDGRSRAGSLGRFRPGRGMGAVLLATAAALAGGITTERTTTSMVADTGSEEPGSPTDLGGFLPIQEDEAELALAPYEDPELLEAVPVSEGAVSDEVAGVLESAEVIETLGDGDIPEVAVEAYTNGADVAADADPGCGLRWTLLAAIGRVESNHGRFGGARLREDGYGTLPIRGIPLDGRRNVALIEDSDDGDLDGDTTYDRAVGPMQFIPSTWATVRQDGNDDGRRDPDNIFDAAQGAGVYLCADGADLTTTAGRARAVRRYNNVDEYVRVVLSLAQMYETGRVEALPDLPVGPGAAASSGPAPSRGFPFDPRPSSPSAPAPSAPPSDRPPTSRPPTATPPPADPTPAPAPAPAPATPRPSAPATPPTPPTTAPPPPSTAPPTPPPSAPPTPPTTTGPPAAPPTTPAPSEPAPPAPPTTVPVDPAPTPPATPDPAEPAPPTTPPAAVGWAPAMREVVVEIVSEAPTCPPAEAPVPTPAPPAGPATDAVAPAPPAPGDPACTSPSGGSSP